MGKLHTLRRAIERDPKAWYVAANWDGRPRYIIRSAWEFENQWQPYYGGRRHRDFVRHVLREIGEIEK